MEDYSIQPLTQMPQPLISLINGVKVDFIRFKYPFIRPVVENDGIRFLSVEDIAPMKLDPDPYIFDKRITWNKAKKGIIKEIQTL
jgi:hypothetical protein